MAAAAGAALIVAVAVAATVAVVLVRDARGSRQVGAEVARPTPTGAAEAEGPEPSEPPRVSATPETSASPPASAPPSPSPPPPPPPGFAELASQISELRGLPVGPLEVRVLPPAEIGPIYSDLTFSEFDPELIEQERRLLVDLRLVEPDIDYVGVVRSLYGEQVNGFYVPAEDVLYVGDEAAALGPADLADLSPTKQVTAAHEITHALQDAAFDLEDVRDIPVEEGDRGLAVLALIEGDATQVQNEWRAMHLSAAERAEADAEASSRSYTAFQAAPRYLQNTLLFPYSAGLAFVQDLRAAGGTAAVDAALRDPPTTTEQILHPEKYRARESALPAELEGDPGPGWEAGRRVSLGEFDVSALFRELGTTTARDIGAGWGGGEVRGWSRGDESATGIAVTFDTPGDQTEMCTAVPQWWASVAEGVATDVPQVLQGDTDVLAYRCDERGVQIGIAADAATARRVAGV